MKLTIKDAGEVVFCARVPNSIYLLEELGRFERHILGDLSPLENNYEVSFVDEDYTLERRNMNLIELEMFLDNLEHKYDCDETPEFNSSVGLNAEVEFVSFNQDCDE